MFAVGSSKIWLQGKAKFEGLHELTCSANDYSIICEIESTAQTLHLYISAESLLCMILCLTGFKHFQIPLTNKNDKEAICSNICFCTR